MPPILIFDIPSAGRSYRVVAEPVLFRVTFTTTTADTPSIVHRRHATLADALADLLLTMITDGSAIVDPMYARATATQAGWKFGRPGFPARSGALRRRAENQCIAFELTVREYAGAIRGVLDEAETCGINLPAWQPIPVWLEVTLEDVEAERLVTANSG